MDQAVAAGLSRRQIYRLVGEGEWCLPLPSVVSTSPAPDWLGRVAAACLWAGTKAGASHTTAAVLWELEGVASSRVELSAGRRKQSPRNWLVVRHVTQPVAFQRRRGIRVTSVARTLLDLAGIASSGVVERAVYDALRRRLTTVDRLRATLRQEGGPGRRGTAALATLLDRLTEPSESELERRVLDLLVTAGLPVPKCQHAIETPTGFRARLDFAYPEAMLAIEADGYRWHSEREKWSRDRTRLNEIVALGWHVLHVTWEDIESGAPDLIRNVQSKVGQQSLPEGFFSEISTAEGTKRAK